jgi:hypothetical protein
MDRTTRLFAGTLAVLTAGYALVFWQRFSVGPSLGLLVAAFPVMAGLSIVLLLRVRRAPGVVVPVALLACALLIWSAPRVASWVVWSVSGFAP